MKKIKTVRMKLFTTLSLITISILLLLIMINSLFLKTFYTVTKIESVKSEYYKINQLYNQQDELALQKIKNDAVSNNFNILIANEEYFLVFSTDENFENTVKQYINNSVPLMNQIKEKTNILFNKDNILIRKIIINGNNSILLVGKLDNNYNVYIEMPISIIDESVRISNNVLFIIGIIIIFIGGIVALYVSKKFATPISELNNIANKMSKLDFSQKYKGTGTDDEMDELGHSINIMSDKLEKTIKQLRRSNSELERDIEEKSKIDEMRKQFISDVSHELKTPIALIQGYAEGLIENVNVDDESRKYYAEVILDESNKMDKLVKQLLELMKLEDGKREFDNSKFNICELIQEVIRKCNVMLEEHKIKEIKFDTNKKVYVYADEFYIEQVFTNYFTNAIKHTKDINGEKYIEIKIEEKEDKARISVFNTGEIIPEEKIDKIWGRFYKADESRNRSDGGSGIGLALVKAIMNNIDSDYGVINEEMGVRFYFDIAKDKEK